MNKLQEAAATEMVKEIQGGNEGLWTELFINLTEHRKASINNLHSTSLKGIDRHEIEAFYDDTLMETVRTFDADKADNYVKYLWQILKLRVGTLLKGNNGKQVTFEGSAKRFESDSTANHSEHELIADTAVAQDFTQLEDAEYLTGLLEGYVQDAKAKQLVNCQLIVAHMQGHDLLDGDRRDLVLSVLPEGTTWDTARRRLNRARQDFAEYLKESL